MINMGTSSVFLSVDTGECLGLCIQQEMVDIIFSMLSASSTSNNIQKSETSTKKVL